MTSSQNTIQNTAQKKTQKIAVIGSGVAGLSSAYSLSKTHHHVDLYEADSRIGGHTHTVTVEDAMAGPMPIDTGFIVFNQKNYPNFIRFITELDVPYKNSDMSFSVACNVKNFCYGSDFPSGIFAQKRHRFSPNYYRFLYGIYAFNQDCLNDLEKGLPLTMSLGEYIEHRKIPHRVVMDYILPMTGAIWSVSIEQALTFPIVSFIRFWNNHHLLKLKNRLKWKTIDGGAHQYIQKVLPKINGQIYTNSPVQAVERHNQQVSIQLPNQTRHYDAVVIATHADQALKLLTNPTELESRLLGAWHYSVNDAILHTDPTLMPQKRAAWCSWNVLKSKHNAFHNPVCVTYWMNRLQSLPTDTNYFVTLNPHDQIQPSTVIQTMHYTHPIMDQAAIATQQALPLLNHQSNIVFAGSYFGYGFHEDAVTAGMNATAELSKTLEG